MKRIRFNTKVGRSAGLGAFRTKGRDYPMFYRTLYEMGRNDLIEATVDYSTTIYGAPSYIDTQKMWKGIDNRSNIWSDSYWMHEDVIAWTRNRMNDIKKVYRYLDEEYGVDFINEHYTPVYYDNINRNIQKDFAAFAQHLMEDCAGWQSMELFNFALRTLDDGREVLYARTQWLMKFKSGSDIINYYRIAKEKNFYKVYRF